MEYVMGRRWSDPPLTEKEKEMVATAIRARYKEYEAEMCVAPFTLLGKDEPIKGFSSQREWLMDQMSKRLEKQPRLTKSTESGLLSIIRPGRGYEY